MTANLDISDKNSDRVIEILSSRLSNEMMLYIKTRKAHWSVTGESLIELNKLLESQCKQIKKNIDEIAERISESGGKKISTVQEFSRLAIIKEARGKYSSSKDMIKKLLKGHETVIVQLRIDIEDCSAKYIDVGTADFLAGLMKQHEAATWILRRYLN